MMVVMAVMVSGVVRMARTAAGMVGRATFRAGHTIAIRAVRMHFGAKPPVVVHTVDDLSDLDWRIGHSLPHLSPAPERSAHPRYVAAEI